MSASYRLVLLDLLYMRENLVMVLSHTSTHTDYPTCSVMAGSPQEQYATRMNLLD